MHRQVHVHSGTNCKRTCIDKFMYIQARLASSNIICMHALHVITLKHCHIVAMGMTLLQLPNSLLLTKLTLEVLLIKHWRQSAFAETLSTTRRSREARRRRASLLVYIYLRMFVCLFVCSQKTQKLRNGLTPNAQKL